MYKYFIAFLIALIFQGELFPQEKDLNYYILSAGKNNPVLNENNSLIATYNLRKELVKASVTGPSIFTTANYLFAPTYKDFGYDSAITNGGLYSALINVDFPLFKGSALNIKLKSAEIDQNTYINNISTTKHDIEKNISDQYLKSFTDLKQIDFINEQIELLKTQREVVITLAHSGLFKISDIKLLDIEYRNQIINLNKQEISYKQDLLDLNLLAGISDTSYVTIKEPDIRLNKYEVNKSNYLTQYEIDSLKLDMDQKQLELNYKPQLDFFVNGGLNAVTYKDIEKKFGFSTGLNFTFNLYDGNQLKLNEQMANIKKNILSNYKSIFIKQNKIRKANILKEITELDSLYNNQKEQVLNYRSLLDIYGNEIPTAQVTVIDYINVLKKYYSAENDMLLTGYQRIILINEYNYWNW